MSMPLSLRLFGLWSRVVARLRHDGEEGQTTAEYALVIVAAAAVAALVLMWASRTHTIARLFDVTIGKVIDRIG